LISAPHDKEFIFHDGSRVKNLLELVLKLEHMADHEFHQFVTSNKNDFANWIEHVLCDKHFADKLRIVMSKNETILLIKDKIEETTIGNSIIKIPRLEDRSEHHNIEHHEAHKEHDEKHDEHQISTVDEHTAEKHAQKEHSHEKGSSEINSSNHLSNHGILMKKERNPLEKEKNQEEKEKHKEKSKELKTKHNWFQLFSNKEISKSQLEKIELKEEDKLHAEIGLQEEVAQEDRDNALWIILYFALVLLIITLLVYKLFL